MNKDRYLLLSFVISFILLTCNNNAVAQTELPKNSYWGIRVAANAITSLDFEGYAGDVPLKEESYTNKVGFSLVGFMRIKLDQFFFQPEISWNTYRQQLSFLLPQETYDASYDLSLSYYTANMTMLVGYNIIENGPYAFSPFLGASFKYNYKTDFKSNNFAKFSTNRSEYNYLGILGVSFCIDKVYFDFRYEFNFPGTDIEFGKINKAPEALKDVLISKNENVLSFSVGLIF